MDPEKDEQSARGSTPTKLLMHTGVSIFFLPGKKGAQSEHTCRLLNSQRRFDAVSSKERQ